MVSLAVLLRRRARSMVASDPEFAAMMKRLGIPAPKGGWGKKSTPKKSRKRTLSPAAKRRRPSPRELQKNKLLHSSTKDLVRERIARRNSPLRLRTDVYRDIDLPREIRLRKSAQEARKGGGMIGKNKVIQGYKKGGQV